MRKSSFLFALVLSFSIQMSFAHTNTMDVDDNDFISFADQRVKTICVNNWDANEDGELSYGEAKAVTSLGKSFMSNKFILSFDELQYFTGLKNISNSAFYCCLSLEHITIPEGVTTIGEESFYGCENLMTVVVPTTLKDIRPWAFYGCGLLSVFVFPESMKSIGASAFVECKNLKSITIPSGVESIGGGCFRGCSGLNSIVVDAANKTYNSANNCNAIISNSTGVLIAGCSSTLIPNSANYIDDYAFSGLTELTNIIVPNSVISIGDWAFCNCTSLENVTLSESLRRIGQYAFAGCSSLKSIVIPSSVDRIEIQAFADCYTLESVTSYINNVFATGSSAFLNCENAKLYVQGDLIDTYKATADWKRLKNVEPIMTKMTVACNSQGCVAVNGGETISGNICEVEAMENATNTLVFSPNNGCKLEQVLLNGEDVTGQVAENSLNAVIIKDSKLIVTFHNGSSDMDVNHDGSVDISDVVTLVNFILGN